MPKQSFTPGTTVTVADLEVGDLIYASHNLQTKEPSKPVEVVRLQPSAATFSPPMVRVVVRNLIGYELGPWPIGRSGYLALDKTFTRAVPAGA